jgi:hypothetical protein
VTVVKIETPREYFDHLVNLDVDDLIDRPTDIRLAYHACISLVSLRDWILKAYANIPWSWQTNHKYSLNQKELHEALNGIRPNREPDMNFAIVSKIANASKHMVLQAGVSANVEVKAATTARGGALFGGSPLGTFAPGQPSTVSTSDRIQVKINTKYFDVLTCVVKVRAIWVALLQENSW